MLIPIWLVINIQKLRIFTEEKFSKYRDTGPEKFY